jgi:hypothetical protein
MSQRSVLLWILVPIGLAAIWAMSMIGPGAKGPAPAATASDETVAVEPRSGLPSRAPLNVKPPTPRAQAVPSAPAAPPAPAAQPAEAVAMQPPAQPPAEPEAPSEDEPQPGRPNPSELFSAAFLEETRDAVWAPEAESRVHAAFATANVPLGALLSVQCRSTLCKIDMLFDRRQHAAFATATRELRREFFSGDISLDHQSAPTNKGPERMTAYIPRKGHTIKDYE